jgi:hypothetical protein
MSCEHSKTVARGLCSACYTRALRDGTVTNHPRILLKEDDLTYRLTPRQQALLEDIEAGAVRSLADAPRVGYTGESLERVLRRMGRPSLARLLRRRMNENHIKW